MKENFSIKYKWMRMLTAIFTFGLVLSICIGISSATIDLEGIVEDDFVGYNLDVNSTGLVSVSAWTNVSSDQIDLFLYNETGVLVDSHLSYYNDAHIDYIASTTGTYSVKVHLDYTTGGVRTVSASSNRVLSLMPKYQRSVSGVEEGEAIWYDLSVTDGDLVFLSAWTNVSSDHIYLFLYNETGVLVDSHLSYNDAHIDYIASTTGTYSVKVHLDYTTGGVRTVSASSNRPFESMPASVSIITDEKKYSVGDTMMVTLNIDNPTSNPVMFGWYIGVPQSSTWVTYASAPISPGYSNTHSIPIPVGNWGPSPLGLVHYVHILDTGTGEVLAQDSATFAYSPTSAIVVNSKVDIVKEIKKSSKKVELS